MLMDLVEPLPAWEEVELTLSFEDGTELVVTATVKDFAGAQEEYEPEGSTASDGGGHEGHHGPHSHEGHGSGADGTRTPRRRSPAPACSRPWARRPYPSTASTRRGSRPPRRRPRPSSPSTCARRWTGTGCCAC